MSLSDRITHSVLVYFSIRMLMAVKCFALVCTLRSYNEHTFVHRLSSGHIHTGHSCVKRAKQWEEIDINNINETETTMKQWLRKHPSDNNNKRQIEQNKRQNVNHIGINSSEQTQMLNAQQCMYSYANCRLPFHQNHTIFFAKRHRKINYTNFIYMYVLFQSKETTKNFLSHDWLCIYSFTDI